MSELTRRLRRYHPTALAVAAIGIAVTGFGSQDSSMRVDEITVQRIRVVDAEGRERISIAGEFPPRRKELAGLLFHNEDGNEAGGLVYHGRRNANGQIEAGGLLTFDQYREDQIMILRYDHVGDEKTNGLTIADRPDEMSDRMLAFYGAMEAAQSDEERARIQEQMWPEIPPEERPARRLFVGRNIEGASLVSLCDKTGQPRLNLEVDENGAASITFLDASGKIIRTITP